MTHGTIKSSKASIGQGVRPVRVLAWISDHATAVYVVERAAQLANLLHGKLVALLVETPETAVLGTPARNRITAAMALVEQFGGESAIMPGEGTSRNLPPSMRSRILCCRFRHRCRGGGFGAARRK